MTGSTVASRLAEDEYRRLERVCEAYGLKKSAIIRMCIHYGLDRIEEDGLDDFVGVQLAD